MKYVVINCGMVALETDDILAVDAFIESFGGRVYQLFNMDILAL